MMEDSQHRFLRNQRARRIAEDHVRRLVAPELFYDEHERIRRVQERLADMAAAHGNRMAGDDDAA